MDGFNYLQINDGKTYYPNNNTKQPQWKKPTDFN